MTGTSTDLSFASWLEQRRERVDSAMRRCLDEMAAILPAHLHAAVESGVTSSGKRIRPLLLAAAYEESGGRPADALWDLSVSVELIHAYSLIHDDLPCMDDAPLRRGRPTVHAVHGVHTATYAGAILIPWATDRAYRGAVGLGCTAGRARLVSTRLLDAAGAGGLIGGQALDLMSEGRSLDEAQLATLHGKKTGALLTVSMEIGALAADAPAPVVQALGAFGRELGLAFQVTDDVLDATGSAEVLGKQPSDAQLDKSTYVGLLGVGGARRRASELVANGLGALDASGLAAPRLRQLAHFVVQRKR